MWRCSSRTLFRAGATVHIIRAMPLSLDFMKQEEMAWPGVPEADAPRTSKTAEAPRTSKAAPPAKKRYGLLPQLALYLHLLLSGPLAALAHIPPAPTVSVASTARSNFSVGIETSDLAQSIANQVRKCLETNALMEAYQQRLEQIYMEHRQVRLGAFLRGTRRC